MHDVRFVRTFILILGVVLTVSTFPTVPANAATILTATTETKIHRFATSESETVGILERGQRVVAVSTHGGWTNVHFSGGNAYISERDISRGKHVKLRVSVGPGTVRTATKKLNVRSGPIRSMRVIGVLGDGVQVTMTGMRSKGYGQIVYEGGTAWTSLRYLATLGGALPKAVGVSVANSALDVMATSDPHAEPVEKAGKGARLQITGVVHDSRAQVIYKNNVRWVSAEHLAIVRPGLSAGTGPRPRFCRGVLVSPRDDVQGVIDRHAAGTTYCLAAGIYRLDMPLEPKEGDTLIGARGAVLSGSKVLHGWRKEGRVWWTVGFLPPAPAADDDQHCRESEPTCVYTEDVFLNKKRLNRVDSVSDVTVGTVHADYSTNTITIGDDPRTHLVEQAVAPGLIQGTVDGVTIANFVLEEAANEAQVGAVETRQVPPGRSGADWRIIHNEVRLNHGVGLGFADGATVAGNFIHHQGQLGFGAWGTGSVVSSNEISFNGTAGYSWEWEAGGSKSWQTDRETIVHNYVHNNWGPGLWADGGTRDTRYEYNKITDNWAAGIQHEISYDATIRHNEVSGNGRSHKGWAWEAGIQIQSSGGAELIDVAYNVVENNANGITLIDSGGRDNEDPKPNGSHVVRNVRVHDNIVTMSAGQATGAFEDGDDPRMFTDHNEFEANTYYLDSLTESHFDWAQPELNWNQWQGAEDGHDRHGRAELWPLSLHPSE